MFPQARRWPSVVFGIVVVIWLLNNPAGAAHAANMGWHAIQTFATDLNFGK